MFRFIFLKMYLLFMCSSLFFPSPWRYFHVLNTTVHGEVSNPPRGLPAANPISNGHCFISIQCWKAIRIPTEETTLLEHLCWCWNQETRHSQISHFMTNPLGTQSLKCSPDTWQWVATTGLPLSVFIPSAVGRDFFFFFSTVYLTSESIPVTFQILRWSIYF